MYQVSKDLCYGKVDRNTDVPFLRLLFRNANENMAHYVARDNTITINCLRAFGETLVLGRDLGLPFAEPHSSLLNKQLDWRELIFLMGYEEMCHAIQFANPDLRLKLAKEGGELLVAGSYCEDPNDPLYYTGGSPMETHAGLMKAKALEAYRARVRQ